MDKKIPTDELFEDFKSKLHNEVNFSFYDVFDWMYDLLGTQPIKSDVNEMIKDWAKKGFIQNPEIKGKSIIFYLSPEQKLHKGRIEHVTPWRMY